MPFGPFVVLDWDNTLHDSAGTNFAALERVLAGYAVRVTPQDYRRAYSVDWRRLYTELGLAAEHLDEASAQWRRLVAQEQPRLLPGAAAALNRLRAAGTTLALITTAPRVVAERQVQGTGLGRIFAAIRYGDGQPPRPDPAPLLELLQEVGAQPSEAALCSDTTADMRMAVGAGVRAVGIVSFVFDGSALCAAGAEETASSVAEWASGDGDACPGGSNG